MSAFVTDSDDESIFFAGPGEPNAGDMFAEVERVLTASDETAALAAVDPRLRDDVGASPPTGRRLRKLCAAVAARDAAMWSARVAAMVSSAARCEWAAQVRRGSGRPAGRVARRTRRAKAPGRPAAGDPAPPRPPSRRRPS